MTKTPSWRRYLTFWRTRIADDVSDELCFHADMRVEEYVARGMSEEDARRAVAARLGDVASATAECIELGYVRETHARRADFFAGVQADVRYALRSLARTPAWTAVALLTIGLGVGATTAVFSVVDTLLVRTIPYPNASRVYIVKRQFPVKGGQAAAPIPVAAVREWRANARSIEAAVPYRLAASSANAQGLVVHGAVIDTAFLAFAGVHPLLGRNFSAEELQLGGPAAVLLAEPFWRRQFGAATDIVGKVVQIGEMPRTIVGVVPASASIPEFVSEPPDVFVPLQLSPKAIVTGVLIRLTPDASPATATQELDAIYKRANLEVPSFAPGVVIRLALTRPQDNLNFRQALLMLTGAVALLLLVACTNIAHLLLARGASRQRELAVRHALGAGRARLLRQLVTESVVLAVLGGVLALAVGWAGLRLLAALRPPKLYALAHVSTDQRLLTFAAVLAIACGLAIGLLAALRSAHRNLGVSLRVGTSSSTRAGRRLRASLVVGEVAFSATLLVGALLLIHAVFNLQRVQLGFDPRGLYGVTFSLPRGATPADRSSFEAMLRQRASGLPGVTGLTFAADAPSPSFWRMLSALETPERPVTAESPKSFAVSQVEADYFETLRMPLIAGHTFDASSVTRNEVVISATLARQLWPDGNAIGGRVRNAPSLPGMPSEEWKTVIGIAPDIVLDLVGGNVLPAMYQPLGGTRVALIIRATGADPATRLKQFAGTIQPNNPNILISNVQQQIAESVAEPRFTMRILVVFAALGVVLSAVGLFGVISYSVGQRTREIGVRMTLGATSRSIARLVVGDGVRLALMGIVVGLGGAVATTRVLQGLLFGLSRFDPLAFGVGALALLAVSIVACIVPTLRAMRIDPAIAVRVE